MEDESSIKNFVESADVRRTYWVYILKCHDNTLYTGIARDPYRRLKEHNAGKGAKYTRGRRPCQLVYAEEQVNRSVAQSREYQIKRLPRDEKLDLIKRGGKVSREVNYL